MAAFDLTTTPKSLALKPGGTATIVVVVSNRLGKPVMARVDPKITPPTVAAWVVPPAELQRRYEADPAATLTFEFGIKVPANATPQAVQFRADVMDVLAPDDNRASGETVAIDVSLAPRPVKTDKAGIPWWVWLVAAVVLLGVGFGIFMIVKGGGGGVPDVMALTSDKAREKLLKAGFDSTKITVLDSLVSDAKDTVVIRQAPEAKADMPPKEARDTATAAIWISRASVPVPAIMNLPLPLAINRLDRAGLHLDPWGTVCTTNSALDEQVSAVTPPPGVPVLTGSNIAVQTYNFSPSCFTIGVIIWRSPAEKASVVNDALKRRLPP